MANLKFAVTGTRLTNEEGLSFVIQAGQPWDADDPLVRQHPSYFADEPPIVAHTVPRKEDLQNTLAGPRVVEQGTAAPGEQRRRVGRPRKVTSPDAKAQESLPGSAAS